ncbi:hypothetical protein RCH20_001289 [Psychrobacter sp. PL15]|uniref:hypothetical protein n=1 Tax=Psychrobacter sp. PL15 TaxID=3071719 RepID=UPI002DF93620|nr:hypothetical protein [Psychrobacter sp. PL15]
MNLSAKILELRFKVTRWIALSFILILLPSYSVLAAVTCDAGFIPDNFANSDYTNLAPNTSPPTPKSNQNIIGVEDESYLVASNILVTDGSLNAGSTNTYQSVTARGDQVFEFFQDFADETSTRTVSYTFKNKFTGQPQALDKVSLSIFDLDSNITRFFFVEYFNYFDQVTITGVTSPGTVISPAVTYKGQTITNSAPYRQTSTTSDFSCSSLDDRCKVSVTFDQPVIKVDVTYGNRPNVDYSRRSRNGDPGNQLIYIEFDGYCYQPQPRLTYTKKLSAPRKTDTDEFVVQIKDTVNNTVITSDITTTTTAGEGNTVTNGTGTTGTFKVDPTKTYILTEAIAGTTNLRDYTASYMCKKSDGTTVTTLDPKNLKLTYGDNWSCTITNGRPNYTFSGIVFNDNGGITDSSANRQNISPTFTGNSSYFNGAYDGATESGIYNSNLRVRLTDCSGNNITTTSANPQTVSSAQATIGRYNFMVSPSVLANRTKVCLVESEPSSWDYTIDTTSNTEEVTLVANVYDYRTEINTTGTFIRNLDFGEVKGNNTALVLIKSQYVHECNDTLNYQSVSDNPNPTVGFSVNPINDVSPGNCIAYRIQSYNRGHVSLQQVQINDKLQSIPVRSSFQRPTPLFLPASVGNPTVAYGTNGEIQSNQFSLAATPSGSTQPQPNSATLYFNTKYGTTQSD